MTARSTESPHSNWLLGLVAAVLFLAYLLGPVLTPFLFATILAYICNPLVDRLVHYKIPRTLAVLLIIVGLLFLITAVLFVLIPLFETQIVALLGKLPELIDWAEQNISPWLSQKFHIDLHFNFASIKSTLITNVQQGQGAMQRILPSLTSGGAAIFQFLINALLLPVVLFYFLRDWKGLIRRMEEMIPRRWHHSTLLTINKIDGVLGQYLRGQFLVMLVMSVYYATTLSLTGLESAIPIGILTGLLVFIPYVGATLGLCLATLAGLVQFGELDPLIWLWVAFFGGQILEGMVVTPHLIGDRIGLHPVAVIFALLAFGRLFGFVGVLLALPITAVLVVWLKQLHHVYLHSQLYK